MRRAWRNNLAMKCPVSHRDWCMSENIFLGMIRRWLLYWDGQYQPMILCKARSSHPVDVPAGDWRGRCSRFSIHQSILCMKWALSHLRNHVLRFSGMPIERKFEIMRNAGPRFHEQSITRIARRSRRGRNRGNNDDNAILNNSSRWRHVS